MASPFSLPISCGCVPLSHFMSLLWWYAEAPEKCHSCSTSSCCGSEKDYFSISYSSCPSWNKYCSLEKGHFLSLLVTFLLAQTTLSPFPLPSIRLAIFHVTCLCNLTASSPAYFDPEDGSSKFIQNIGIPQTRLHGVTTQKTCYLLSRWKITNMTLWRTYS